MESIIASLLLGKFGGSVGYGFPKSFRFINEIVKTILANNLLNLGELIFERRSNSSCCLAFADLLQGLVELGPGVDNHDVH